MLNLQIKTYKKDINTITIDYNPPHYPVTFHTIMAFERK